MLYVILTAFVIPFVFDKLITLLISVIAFITCFWNSIILIESLHLSFKKILRLNLLFVVLLLLFVIYWLLGLSTIVCSNFSIFLFCSSNFYNNNSVLSFFSCLFIKSLQTFLWLYKEDLRLFIKMKKKIWLGNKKG